MIDTINFEDEMKDAIAEAFEINGIPALLVFDKNGKLIDYDGRMTVQTSFMKDSGEDVASKILDGWKK